MSLIAFASAKGAPGVTTLAVVVAALSPRPTVVAELDPAGGDLALRYRNATGGAIDPEHGLLSLGAQVRRGDGGGLLPHLQTLPGGLEIVAGASTPQQIGALGPVWPVLGRALRSDPARDVIADCGRLGDGSTAMPILHQAAVVVLVCNDSPEQLFHVRERIRALQPALVGGTRLAVAVVAPVSRRNVGADAQKLFHASGFGVPVLGRIAYDPKGAAVVAGTRSGNAGRTTLVRSVRSLMPALIELARPLADPASIPAEAMTWPTIGNGAGGHR
jgi:hypothetical protein